MWVFRVDKAEKGRNFFGVRCFTWLLGGLIQAILAQNQLPRVKFTPRNPSENGCGNIYLPKVTGSDDEISIMKTQNKSYIDFTLDFFKNWRKVFFL